MAKEYIEREAALVAIKNLYPGIPLAKIRLQKWHEENKNFMECELAIERIPAADVVHVVRCGECVHSALDYIGERYCKGVAHTSCSHVPDDWFCADGKRKDGDGE